MKTMKRQSKLTHNETTSSLERLPGYLTIKEAARIIGVSERSVYGYVKAGKLSGGRVGHIIAVSEEHARAYERKAPGRLRTITPPWHIPPLNNPQYLTTIKVLIRPGQDALLDRKLSEMRVARKHLLPGTAARYIAHDQHDPAKLIILLVWRSAVMPPDKEREAALAALTGDLADVLDWETAISKEGQVLLHA
jgi:excisionase family DNA binding protein